MTREPMPAYAFGPFQLDPSEHRLQRDGCPVPLTPKIFDVLCVLVRNHGRLVPKDRLLAEVWPDTFVDEANLNRSISVLRKALGERAGEQRYIETIPKVGYRFVAPVTGVDDQAPQVSAAPAGASPPQLVPPRGRWSVTRVAGLIASAAGLALLVYALGPTAFDTPQQRPVESAASHRQLTFTGHESVPAISPDGRRLAYVSSNASVQRVMVRASDGGEPVEIASGSAAGFLRWSPTGDALLFWLRTREWEGIHLSTTRGEPPRRMSRGRYVAAWSPDGSTIASAAYLVGRIAFYDRDGHEQRAATFEGNPFWVWDMDWSPAGDRLLLTTSDTDARYTVSTIRPDGGDRRTLLEDRAEIANARWDPRGDSIVYSRRANQAVSLFRLPVSRGARVEGAEPSAVLTGLEIDRAFGFTADGRHLVYARAPFHSNLWRLDLSAAGEHQQPRTTQLTNGTSLVERPRISPDGSTVVFNMGRESLANLYTIPIDGGVATAVTRRDAFSLGGVWSPDGTQIAYASTKDGVSGVWMVDAGRGTPRAMFTGAISDSFDVAWHPGTQILFQQPGNRDYLALDPASGTTRPLVKDSSVGWVTSPVVSPDGRRVALSWNRREGRGIWTIDRTTGAERLVRRSTAESLMPIGWSADGRLIYAVEAKGAIFRGQILPRGETTTGTRIVSIGVDDGEMQPVATLPFDEVGTVTMTPDARRFVFAVYSSTSDVWVADLTDGAL